MRDTEMATGFAEEGCFNPDDKSPPKSHATAEQPQGGSEIVERQ